MKASYKELIHQYYSEWRRLDAVYAKWAKQRGISYYELLLLYSLLERKEGCTQKALCQEWNLPKQTVHSILRHLQERELLELYVLPRDRRNKKICLSEEGKHYAKEIITALQKEEEAAIEAIGEVRMRRLIEDTQCFSKAFEGGMQDV